MIEKRSDYFEDGNTDILNIIDTNSSEGIIKTAESYSPELQEKILQLEPKEGKTYALCNAMTAYEYFGPNRNNDAFEDEVLKRTHKTFEKAGVYVHHKNKDQSKSLGRVLFAFYNDKMKRVELLLELDDEKASEIVKKLKDGNLLAVSMGSKNPYDVCSICGKKSKNRNEYCDHLKKMMGKILPNGKKVFAFNPHPNFFDISFVTIPADRTAGIIKVFLNLDKKKASDKKIIDQIKSLANNENNVYIKEAEYKNATIKKYTPVELISMTKITSVPESSYRELPYETVKTLSTSNLEEALSTLLGLRIIPQAKDFQKIVLNSTGFSKLAEEFEDKGIVFTNINKDSIPEIDLDEFINLDNFNEKLAFEIKDAIPLHSLTKELIVARELVKTAQMIQFPNITVESNLHQPEQKERSFISKLLFNYTPDPPLTPEKNPVIPLSTLGGLYLGYLKLFNKLAPEKYDSLLVKYPWLLPLLIGAGTAGSLWAQKNEFNKTASLRLVLRNSLVAVPVSYYLSGKAENKVKKGIPISRTENFIRKHPILSALLGALGTAKVEKWIFKTAEFLSELPENEFNNLYNEIITEAK